MSAVATAGLALRSSGAARTAAFAAQQVPVPG